MVDFQLCHPQFRDVSFGHLASQATAAPLPGEDGTYASDGTRNLDGLEDDRLQRMC